MTEEAPESVQPLNDPSAAVQAAAASIDVFISYASQDTAVANSVVAALERQGIKCWIAPRNVTPGAFYADEIVHAIDTAKAIVLILSQNAGDSQHVLREVERAASKRHPVVSLRIDQAPMPAGLEYFLNTSQWLDASVGDIARSMPKIIAAVRVAIQAPLPRAPTPRAPGQSPSARPPKRTAIIVASLLGLVIAGFAIWESSRRAAPTSLRTAAAPAIPQKSVAVLPFVDMSEKKDQEYFADGMAEEVLDQLVKVPLLKVISRAASFQYKGKTTDVRVIGTELGARYLVEGSVRKSGTKLRITAELIDAQDGARRWADRYDRDIDDVLKVQDDIAISVVRALEVTVDATELPTRAAVRVPAAYDAYLRGRHAADRFNQRGFEEAADEYREALRLDPTFARAAAALAFVQTALAIWGGLPVDRAFREARASAQLAIRLDGTLAMPHAILSRTHVVYDWDWQAARDELTKATTLQPRDPTTEWVAGELAMAEGNWDEAIRHYNASIALEPLVAAVHYQLSATLIRAGRLEEAEVAIRKAMQISPSYVWAHYQLGNVLVLRGKPTDALAAFQEEPDPAAHLYGLTLANFALGRRQESDTALKELTKLGAVDWAFGIATVHAYRGEVDQAFMWLERAYAQKDVDLFTLKGDPMSAKIWPDPRYKQFLRKMNLPE